MKVMKEMWERYTGLHHDDLPPAVRQIASQCLLDWTGCALAGSREPLAGILREEFAAGQGDCVVLGSGETTSPGVAALVNGSQGHALDFDDTSTVMGGHPSAPVIPAVLAQAQSQGCTGEEFLTALVTGIEVESRLGLMIGPEHYQRGWHVTSTIGVLGAAAGAAFLLGLDEEHFGHAMGLAVSQASGLKANFGTMTKPFHAGHAAERGLLSARLAARGFTSNPAGFESPQGLVEAASGGRIRSLAEYGDQWLTESVLFKYHAACYLTHAGIECVLKKADETSVDGVQEIEVWVHPSLLDVCGIENPVTGLEAKFSLRATAALAILGFDTTDPATFSDETVLEERVQDMIRRVRVETDPGLRSTGTRVRIGLDTGRTLETSHDTGVPASDLDAQQGKLEAKFRSLVSTVADADVTMAAVLDTGSCRNMRYWLA